MKGSVGTPTQLVYLNKKKDKYSCKNCHYFGVGYMCTKYNMNNLRARKIFEGQKCEGFVKRTNEDKKAWGAFYKNHRKELREQYENELHG